MITTSGSSGLCVPTNTLQYQSSVPGKCLNGQMRTIHHLFADFHVVMFDAGHVLFELYRESIMSTGVNHVIL